jgi:predicted histone-like DNA-binding protein
MAIQYKVISKRNPQNPDAEPKYYAIVVQGKTYDLRKLAKELAARSTTASEGDVFSVLIGLRDLMREHFDRSERVLFDGIGTFDIALSSEGAELPEKFHQGLIKKARLNFRPDAEMKGFIRNLKYVKYSSQV